MSFVIYTKLLTETGIKSFYIKVLVCDLAFYDQF